MEESANATPVGCIEFWIQQQQIRITKIVDTPKGLAFRVEFVNPCEGVFGLGLLANYLMLQGPFVISNESPPMMMLALREFVMDHASEFENACRAYASKVAGRTFPGSHLYR